MFGLQTLWADNMKDGHAQGSSWANGWLGLVQDKAKSTAASEVPGFKTDNPSEANLDNGSIDKAAMVAAQSNGAATYISKHAGERQSFKIDPNTDPMMVNANKAMANPEKTLNEIVMEVPGGNGKDEEEIVFCEQGGDEYGQKCSKYLEIKIKVIPEIKIVRCSMCKQVCDSGHFVNYGGTFCRNHLHDFGRGPDYLMSSVSQPRKVEITEEMWSDGCIGLEAQSDAGLCRYESEVKGAPETKTITGPVVNPEPNKPTTDSELITRDVWEKHYTYKCLKKVEGDCHKLSARGCVQIASTCMEKISNVCIAWKQTYRCPSKKQKQARYRAVGDKTPFCFTGDCVNADYQANGELAEAMTHLVVLKEAQDDIRANLGIFKGQSRRCRKAWQGARDCCGSGNRWAVTWKMAPGCDTQEKELGDWRAKRRCVEVGTFCAQKLPIIGCIEKKITFCCFGTKLSKLIQEQGRRQLKMGWGSPEDPNCRGLSPEELSRLDFATMDLSELFNDVNASFKPQSQSHIAKGIELDRIRDNMKHLAPKSKQDLEQEYKNFAAQQSKQQETLTQLRAQRDVAQGGLKSIKNNEAEIERLKGALALRTLQAADFEKKISQVPPKESYYYTPGVEDQMVFNPHRQANYPIRDRNDARNKLENDLKKELFQAQKDKDLLKQQYQTAVDKQTLKRADAQKIINDLDKKISGAEKLLQQCETEHQAQKEAAERRSL